MGLIEGNFVVVTNAKKPNYTGDSSNPFFHPNASQGKNQIYLPGVIGIADTTYLQVARELEGGGSCFFSTPRHPINGNISFSVDDNLILVYLKSFAGDVSSYGLRKLHDLAFYALSNVCFAKLKREEYVLVNGDDVDSIAEKVTGVLEKSDLMDMNRLLSGGVSIDSQVEQLVRTSRKTLSQLKLIPFDNLPENPVRHSSPRNNSSEQGICLDFPTSNPLKDMVDGVQRR